MNSSYIDRLIEEIENYQYYPLLTKENIRLYLEMAYGAGFDKGRRMNSHQKEVVCMDLSGKKLHIFSSAAEAGRQTKTDHSSIINCCKNKQKTAGGYKWKYLD